MKKYIGLFFVLVTVLGFGATNVEAAVSPTRAEALRSAREREIRRPFWAPGCGSSELPPPAEVPPPLE